MDNTPGFTRRDAPTDPVWGDPDMSVLRLNRRPPPTLPLEEVFGPAWAPWVIETAAAAGCSPDYVAIPLLAAVSVLIGNACGHRQLRDGRNRPICGRALSGTAATEKALVPTVFCATSCRSLNAV